MSRFTLRAASFLVVLTVLSATACVDRSSEEQAARVCSATNEERFEDALAASQVGASAAGTVAVIDLEIPSTQPRLPA